MLPQKRARDLLSTNAPSILCTKFTRSGDYLLTAGDDKAVTLWNYERGIRVRAFVGAHGYAVRAVDVSGDNARFASCGEDRCAFEWDVTSGRVVARYFGHSQRINSVALDDAGHILVTGSYDRTVKVWDCRSHSRVPIQTMDDFKDSVTQVLLTESEIIASSVDGLVCSYDIRGSKLMLDRCTDGPVTGISVSRDGRLLLASCMGSEEKNKDGALRLLNRSTGSVVAEFLGHKHKSVALPCSFDSTESFAFAACAEDDYMYFWKIGTGKIVAKLGKIPKLSCAALHPTKSILASASYDGTLSIWE